MSLLFMAQYLFILLDHPPPCLIFIYTYLLEQCFAKLSWNAEKTDGQTNQKEEEKTGQNSCFRAGFLAKKHGDI